MCRQSATTRLLLIRATQLSGQCLAGMIMWTNASSCLLRSTIFPPKWLRLKERVWALDWEMQRLLPIQCQDLDSMWQIKSSFRTTNSVCWADWIKTWVKLSRPQDQELMSYKIRSYQDLGLPNDFRLVLARDPVLLRKLQLRYQDLVIMRQQALIPLPDGASEVVIDQVLWKRVRYRAQVLTN